MLAGVGRRIHGNIDEGSKDLIVSRAGLFGRIFAG